MSAPKAATPRAAHEASLAFAATLAALALGYALQLGNGYASRTALVYLVFAFVAPLLALLLPREASIHRLAAGAVTPTLVAGVVLQASCITAFAPAKYLQLAHAGDLWPLHVLVLVIVGLAITPAWQCPHRERWRWRWVCAASFAMGVWLIYYSPSPHIDVFEYAKNAPRALLRGNNPYAAHFADVYGQGQNAYAPGLSDGHTTTVGFPYLPIHLYVLTLGTLLGDPRVTLQLLVLVAATLVARFGPSPRRARLAAVAMLLTPRCLMLLEQSFLEPLAIAMVAAVAVASRRRPAWVPYLFGALLVTKQPMPLLAGTAWLLPQFAGSLRTQALFAVRALAAGCVLTLPFIVASPAAFYRSAVQVHFLQQQHRSPESLTLATYIVRTLGGAVPPLWWCLALLAATSALFAWRARRDAATFSIGIGSCYAAFLLFAPQAFANYHHQVLASLFIGVGLADFGALNKAGESQ